MGILGLGGVGKTQIALKLAFWVKENLPDYSVFWIPALSKESFENTCAGLVREIGLPKEDGEDDKEVLCRYLSTEVSGKWFIILDNADDVDTVFSKSDEQPGIEKYLPQSEHGRILFTTRTREIAVGMAQNDFTLLKEMTQEEGVAYFRQAIPMQVDANEKETIQLLDLLCHLPLAISQAAAYITKNQSTIAEYLELFQETEVDMIELLDADFKDRTRYKEGQNAVLKTWSVSFDQIEHLDEVAYEILLFVGLVEPKAIPFHCLPTIGPGYEISAEQLNKALDLLCGYEMLHRREDGKTYDMHSLVHVACAMWIKRQERLWRTSHKDAADHLWNVLDPCDWENRETWRPVIPHALALYPSTGSPYRGTILLMCQVAQCLRVDGKLRQALELLEKVKLDVARTFAGDEPEVLFLHQTLATLYFSVGKSKEAAQLLERSLFILNSATDDKASLTPATQLLLANAHIGNGQLQKGIDLYELIIASEKASLSDNGDRLVVAQRGLAAAYVMIGRREEAFSLWKSMLKHGDDNDDTSLDESTYLSIQTELALAYEGDLETDKAEKAMPLMEQIVEAYEKQSIHSEEALGSQVALAHVYIKLGQQTKAIKLLLSTTKVAEDNLGADHPFRISAMTLLAQALSSVGLNERATKIYEWAMATYDRISDYTVLALDRVKTMKGLAREYTRLGKAEEAVGLLLTARKAGEGVPGIGQGFIWDCEFELALAYQVNNQIKESIPLFEKVLDEAQQGDDARHFTRTDLAISYFQVGKRTEAIDILEEVLTYQVNKVSMRNPAPMLTARYLVEFYEIHKRLKTDKPMLSRVSHPPPRLRIAELEDPESTVCETIQNELAYLRNLSLGSDMDLASSKAVKDEKDASSVAVAGNEEQAVLVRATSTSTLVGEQ